METKVVKRVQFQVVMTQGMSPVTVNAYTTPVAGLVVHPVLKVKHKFSGERIIRRRNCWAISLYPCGLRVFGGFPTREHAIEVINNRLAKYSWVGLSADDIKQTNDMPALSAEAVEIRNYIEELNKS